MPNLKDRRMTRAIVIALRRWRSARDRGLAVQPYLASALGNRDGAMLAPVFDSLFRILEAALGRRLERGVGKAWSADEVGVLGALQGGGNPAGIAIVQGIGAPLECAIRSARLMLAKALP